MHWSLTAVASQLEISTPAPSSNKNPSEPDISVVPEPDTQAILLIDQDDVVSWSATLKITLLLVSIGYTLTKWHEVHNRNK